MPRKLESDDPPQGGLLLLVIVQLNIFYSLVANMVFQINASKHY